MFPQYVVDGKRFGTDYETALLYFQNQGQVLMEKLDSFTPWFVLQSKKSMS